MIFIKKDLCHHLEFNGQPGRSILRQTPGLRHGIKPESESECSVKIHYPLKKYKTHLPFTHLLGDFLGKGYKVVADNWFSFLDLVNRLRAQNTSYIGTIRSNKRAKLFKDA